MYRNILVPVEPSHVERHQDALNMARNLAEKSGATITAVTVIEPVPGYFTMAENMGDLRLKAAKSTLTDLKMFVGDQTEIETKILHGHAANEINAYAEQQNVDCIVIASHKPEFSDFLLGSTAARVVRHAPCSVHVMR